MIGQVCGVAKGPSAAAILLCGGFLVGCGAAEKTESTTAKAAPTEPQSAASANEQTKAPSDNPLAGTQWQLVAFQSMDDAIGTLSPDDPSLYTMRLDSDGTVTMRLNCNSASGTWSVEPSDDSASGRFEFGPLAATRALCPPPSLDKRIAADAAFVRSYLLKDRRLYLSLMADAGIYAWAAQEAGVPYETEPNADLEEAILRASPDFTREIVETGKQRARYLYGRVDLNGDSREEVFAYLLGSIFCGTGGCDLLLFAVGEGGYSLVNNFPISRLPVTVSPERTAGWNDIVRLEFGGGAASSYVRHTFNGEKYLEQERLPAEPAPKGMRVLAGDFTFDDGIPLEPRN